MASPKTPAQLFEEESKRALDELFTQTTRYSEAEGFMELVEFIRNFKCYSPFNAMLVHVQRPGARFVLPARKWLSDHGRTLKPGAQPLVILQPMGPVMFLFDVSDTEGRCLPEEVTAPFATRSGQVKDQLEQTITNCARDGVRVRKVAHGSQRAGSIQRSNIPRSSRIEFRESPMQIHYDMLINQNLSRESRYVTLAHELGHLYCGHLGTPDPRWWPDRGGLSLNSREFEAESVAFLVCGRLGIDCAAERYLHGYLEGNQTVPPISLDRVLAAAGLIEQMGKRWMPARKVADHP